MKLFANPLNTLRTMMVASAVLLSFSTIANAECGYDWQADAPLLNTAVHDLAGFGYVRSALAEMRKANPASELCISGLILGKDVYQYGQFFIQADVRSTIDHTVIARMRFLFQDASTQAFQNMHRQPWAVVDSVKVDSLLNKMTNNLTFTPVESFARDWQSLARMSPTYKNFPAESGTVMSVHIDNVPGLKHAHLVSWVTRNDGNSFAAIQIAKGVVVGVNAQGQTVVSNDVWLYDALVSPLETMRSAKWPSGDHDYSQAMLQETSYVPSGR